MKLVNVMSVLTSCGPRREEVKVTLGSSSAMTAGPGSPRSPRYWSLSCKHKRMERGEMVRFYHFYHLKLEIIVVAELTMIQVPLKAGHIPPLNNLLSLFILWSLQTSKPRLELCPVSHDLSSASEFSMQCTLLTVKLTGLSPSLKTSVGMTKRKLLCIDHYWFTYVGFKCWKDDDRLCSQIVNDQWEKLLSIFLTLLLSDIGFNTLVAMEVLRTPSFT